MAIKDYLNYNGLQTFYNKIKEKFALKAEIPITLPANGGTADNSDKVDGYHIVVSSTVPTVNNQSIITLVI